MSSEIYYDKAFIRVEGQYIPIVNQGSSNCYTVGRSGRDVPEKYWAVLNYPHRDKVLFTEEEMQEIARTYEKISRDNCGGIRKSRYRSFEDGEFGRWILSGLKSAHTVEEYRKYGNMVVVFDYDQKPWQKHSVLTTEELLAKLEELAGHSINVAFLDDRHVTHPPMRSKRTPTDFSKLQEFFVLRTERGYFVGRSSRRIWFAKLDPHSSEIRKFKTEKAARKYLDEFQKIYSGYAFEIERVENGE